MANQTSNPKQKANREAAESKIVEIANDAAVELSSYAPSGEEDPVDFYAFKINARWHSSVESILETARWCAGASTGLTATQKQALYGKIPFGKSTFSKLVAIGSDPRFEDPELQKFLPPSYSTMYEIRQLSDGEQKESIAEKVLNSGCSREEIIEWKKEKKQKEPKEPKKDVDKRSKLIDYVRIRVREDKLEEAKAGIEITLADLKMKDGVQLDYPTDKLTKAQNAYHDALVKFERSEAKHVIKRHLDGRIARKNLGHLTRKKAIRAVGYAPEEVAIEPDASWGEIEDTLRFLGLEDEILRIQQEASQRVEPPKSLNRAESESDQADALEEGRRALERKEQSRADRFDFDLKTKFRGFK